MLLVALAALLANDAEAAQIEFRTTRPVAFFVDERPATLGRNLKALSHELEAGPHAIRVQSLFGKTLYETEVQIGADGLVEAEWHGDGLLFSGPPLDAVPELLELEVVPMAGRASEPLDDDGLASAEPADLPLAVPVDAPLALPVSQDPDAWPVLPPVVREVALDGSDEPLRLVISQGDRTVTLEVADGTVRVLDPGGEVGLSLDMAVAAAPGPVAAVDGEVTFLRADDRGALLVVDGEPSGAIEPGASSTTLTLPSGEREVEIRNLDDNRLLYIGRLAVPAGGALQVGFGDDFAPAVADDPAAWRAW